MKTHFSSNILLFCILFSLSYVEKTQAQEIGHNYYFKTNLGKKKTDKIMFLNDSGSLPANVVIKANARIKVLYIEGDKVYFKYLNYSKESPNYEVYNVNTSQEMQVFSMGKANFENFTKRLYNRFRGFRYGAFTIPIRLRSSGGNFEFDSNLSLGANIIGRWGIKKKENMYVDIALGISLTKVNLNKENSILGTPDTDFANIDALSPSAFTVSFGALFSLAENVNIGTYLGWDSLSTADNKAQWIHNKKPWIGIGLNVVFSGNANSSSSEGQNIGD